MVDVGKESREICVRNQSVHLQLSCHLKRSHEDFLMGDNSSSKALVEDSRNSSPEEIDKQDLLAESIIDNSDSLLNVLNA